MSTYGVMVLFVAQLCRVDRPNHSQSPAEPAPVLRMSPDCAERFSQQSLVTVAEHAGCAGLVVPYCMTEASDTYDEGSCAPPWEKPAPVRSISPGCAVAW